jgi:hypothetical protein
MVYVEQATPGGSLVGITSDNRECVLEFSQKAMASAMRRRSQKGGLRADGIYTPTL